MNVLLWAQFGFWIQAKIGNSRIIVGGAGKVSKIEESMKRMGYCPYEDGYGMPRISTWFRPDIAPGTPVVWMPDRTEAEIVSHDGDVVRVKHNGQIIALDEDDFRMNCLLPVEVAAIESGMSLAEYADKVLGGCMS